MHYQREKFKAVRCMVKLCYPSCFVKKSFLEYCSNEFDPEQSVSPKAGSFQIQISPHSDRAGIILLR